MTLTIVLFYFFSFATVASAIAIALTRTVLFACFYMLICLLGTAILFLYAGAGFLAVAQVLLYVGGILILILFGMMVTAKGEKRYLLTGIQNQTIGLFLSLPLVATLAFFIQKTVTALLPTTRQANGVAQLLGIGFLTDYILAFELSAVLLLGALIGATSITAHRKE